VRSRRLARRVQDEAGGFMASGIRRRVLRNFVAEYQLLR
jgi:hypothetical protein